MSQRISSDVYMLRVPCPDIARDLIKNDFAVLVLEKVRVECKFDMPRVGDEWRLGQPFWYISRR